MMKERILHFIVGIKFFGDQIFSPLTLKHKELYFRIHKSAFRALRYFPNILNPKDYNDKIQWLKLFDQHKLVIDLTDKLKAKEYVRIKCSETSIPNVLWVGDSFDSIPFQNLPQCYVIKTNHDSGGVVLVTKEKTTDFKDAKRKIEKSYNRTYGENTGEWAYKHVEKKVFIEEFIGVDEIPADFKFHCSNGKVSACQYIYDRFSQAKECMLSREKINLNYLFDENFSKGSPPSVSDENWRKLVSVAEKLASDFKYVRVDLYLIDNKVYFGEITFFPMYGCYRGLGQKYLGDSIKFDMGTHKCLYSE